MRKRSEEALGPQRSSKTTSVPRGRPRLEAGTSSPQQVSSPAPAQVGEAGTWWVGPRKAGPLGAAPGRAQPVRGLQAQLRSVQSAARCRILLDQERQRILLRLRGQTPTPGNRLPIVFPCSAAQRWGRAEKDGWEGASSQYPLAPGGLGSAAQEEAEPGCARYRDGAARPPSTLIFRPLSGAGTPVPRVPRKSLSSLLTLVLVA